MNGETITHIAMRQAEIISDLSHLCSDVINELAMYRETDAEEQRMEKIMRGDTIESGRDGDADII